MIYLRTPDELLPVQAVRLMCRPGLRDKPDGFEFVLLAFTWGRYGGGFEEHIIAESDDDRPLRKQLQDLERRIASGETVILRHSALIPIP